MNHRQPGNPARCKSTSDDTSGVRVHTTIAFDLSVLPESKDQMLLKEWQSIRVEPTVDAPICFAKFPVVSVGIRPEPLDFPESGERFAKGRDA